jgi:general secretion pathway protein J
MRQGNASGFTLLEILVALTVFGFLLVGLNQTLHLGLVSWRADGRISGSDAALEATDRGLRRIVEALTQSDDATRPALRGTSDSMLGQSTLPLPGEGDRAVPVEVGLALSGNRLVLRWRPYHHAAFTRSQPAPQETTLADNVRRLQVAYWTGAGRWVSRWEDPTLPLLIRFHIVLLGEDAPRWPDIVVAPQLSSP